MVGFEDFWKGVHSLPKSLNVSYPPHNIIRQSNNEYSIELAVAGFTSDQIEITQEDRILSIKGDKSDNRDSSENSVSQSGIDESKYPQYLHRGISSRSFARKMTLADHVEVVGSKLENGMLTVNLERKVPKKMQPRKIKIA